MRPGDEKRQAAACWLGRYRTWLALDVAVGEDRRIMISKPPTRHV
jgi:hypothetical protein